MSGPGAFRSAYRAGILALLGLSLLWAAQTSADSAEPVIEIGSSPIEPIGRSLLLWTDPDGAGPEEALDALADGRFRPSRWSIPSFGIGADPVWFTFVVHNPDQRARLREVAVELAWIDRIDAWFLTEDGRILQQLSGGDLFAYSDRPIPDRHHRFQHEFAPGFTRVLMRLETPDPATFPVYFSTVEASHQRSETHAYLYGFIYGAILILALYNGIIYLRLRLQRYLYYSIYLCCFLAMNLAYTGHGMQWWWPNAVEWQRWAPPLLMTAFAISGLGFAVNFLRTRLHFPRFHRGIVTSCLLFAGLQLTALLADWQSAALIAAFVFVILFCPMMLLLGLMSHFMGSRVARYFIAGSASAAVGALITALTVWGQIPFTFAGYHAVSLGMVLDAIFLARALAELFRSSQEARLHAERVAKLDPLTGLNNRRGFHEIVGPLWQRALARGEETTILVIDVDRFKLINDRLGHNAGDEVLVAVARLLSGSRRQQDVLARWGGEEFILMLPGTGAEAAAEVAERYRQLVAAHAFSVGDSALELTISIGLAHFCGKHLRIDDLLSAADQQLYRAKREGRNRVCVISLPDERRLQTAV